MVSLTAVEASNARIASTLPANLVAVFVGATSGVGETAMKQFAKHARQPRIYFIGRSQAAGDRIGAECKALNPEGEYIFIQTPDVSLLSSVDEVCRGIKSKEKAINLLFLTIGSLIMGQKTSEGLEYSPALVLHCRTRFIVNLLPLLERATSLRRVVSVFAGTKEGPVDVSDIQCLKTPLTKQRGQLSSLVTLSLESLAKKAPTVSFIQSFPGPVKGGAGRGVKGISMNVIFFFYEKLGPLFYMKTVEAGDRHVLLATSAKYPPAESKDSASGVPLGEGVLVARGLDGKAGSGVYSIDVHGESADSKVEELLARYRREGLVEKAWEGIEADFMRITGARAI